VPGTRHVPERQEAYAVCVSCPCCTPPSEYRRFFNRRVARLDARHYRRRGLPRSARGLVAAAGDVTGASVLDIGGGLGTLGMELLEAGAARATNVELSAGWEDAAAALLAEHRLGDRVDRRVGDFVEQAGLVEPHDVVVLHRVVCCYPNVEALVTTAAAHARSRLLLTYPRERALSRVGARIVNLWLRLTRCGFRTYAHPVTRIVAAAESQGLELERRETHGPVWENAAFVRPLPQGVSA
jgi:2-polyprenyl-3-methyl-5-hydroxy-6-metoxy-1,4-benzoquinol methylase